MQVSTTWAFTCPETVHQRPCVTREIETWLSDSTVGNNVAMTELSRPVLSTGVPGVGVVEVICYLHMKSSSSLSPPYLASSFTHIVADMPHRRRLRSTSTEQLDVPPVVGQLSEVVPSLLLEQRCGMACQAMLRRPRRCRCSRTG